MPEPTSVRSTAELRRVRAVVARASSRLRVIDFLRGVVVAGGVALAALVLARVAQKLFPFELPWPGVFLAAVIATLVGGAAWALSRSRSEQDIARLLDERSGLKETLSTALAVRDDQTGWGRTVSELAEESAGRVVVRDAVPIATPRAWPAVLGGALALAAVWWLPTYDVTGLFAKKQAGAEQERAFEEAKAEVKSITEEAKAAAARAGLDVEEPGDAPGEDPIDPTAPKTPEDVRRQAIKQLTNLADQLEELTKNDQAVQVQAVQDAMRRLTDPGPGPASEMARQMAQGDFSKAQDALEQLAQQMQSGDATPEQKQQAAQQLEALKSQLEQAAQQRQELEEQLQAAGFSKDQAQQMAASPEQMQQQLQQNPQNLSAEQMQQLQQQAQAQQAASDAMSSMAQAMGQMAQGLQQNNSGQMSEGAQSMSGQLSQMEMAQQELASAQSALSQVQQQQHKMGCSSCQSGGQCSGGGTQGQPGSFKAGQAQQGQSMAAGSGSGNQPGQGNGSGPDESPADYVFERQKASVNTTEGPVIASSLVYGAQVRGESRATFGQAAAAGAAEAAQAIETRAVPKKLEGAVQHYFGRLEKIAGSGQDAAPAPAAEPAPAGSGSGTGSGTGSGG